MAAGLPYKNMNVLVVGYGSIGKRHVLNLTKLDSINEIFIYTKIKNDLDKSYEKKIFFIDASNVTLIDVCKNRKFVFAIIANETYKHVDTANNLAELGIQLFIEKPISDSVTKAISLKKIAEKNDIQIFVAYNFRFLEALQYIKNQINSGAIGSLYFAEIEVGQYLPAWRPSSDYRESYSASKDKGGGAALDLSHEIDYMRHLFGDPVSWKIMKAKVSDLDIDSDDLFKGIYQFSGGFLCSVHTDYLRHNKKRGINIVGSKGTIEGDFIKKQIKIQKNSGEISFIEDAHLFDVDESYRSELNHFIECMEKDTSPKITLGDGIEVLKLIEGEHV